MLQTAEFGPAKPQVKKLSDLVIPSNPGEFYSYSSEFTKERPLYALMKCKANKNRPTKEAAVLGHEANLLFLFDEDNQVRVCAVKMAHTLGLIDNPIDSSFGETQIASAEISHDEFQDLRLRKDAEVLVRICRSTCLKHEMSITLKHGMIVAMMTDDGKYGLFFVKELSPTSILVDACHILL